MCDQNPLELYTYLINQLSLRNVAFIEVKDDTDPNNSFDLGYPASKAQIPDLFEVFRPIFKGTLLANNQYTPESASEGI